MKKLIALLLALVMVLGMAACGAKEETAAPAATEAAPAATEAAASSSAKDPITLEWWYFGNGVQQDTEKVEAAFNELLHTFEGMEHVNVNLNPYAGKELATAVPLAQTSGQQIDLLHTFRLNFQQEVENGTFRPITEYYKNSEGLQTELPEWLFEMGMVNDELYIVPTYQRPANMDYVVTPKEWVDAWGDKDEFAEIIISGDIERIATLLEEYLLVVRGLVGDNHYMRSLGQEYTSGYGFKWQWDTLVNNFVLMEGSDKVEHRFLTDDVVRAYEITAEWFEKGYIRDDIMTLDYYAYEDLSNTAMMEEGGLIIENDSQAGDLDFLETYFAERLNVDEVYVFPMTDHYYIANVWGAGGVGVTAQCEHPDEAFRLIELLNTAEGAALYNMVVYGLEGEHYEKIDDTHIKTLDYDGTEGTEGEGVRYSARRWIMGNTNNLLFNQATPDNSVEIAYNIGMDPTTTSSNHIGLVISTADIETELQQITAVEAEYTWLLAHGAMGDEWETYYNEFLQKLEAAGYSKVIENLQAQVDAFMASK